MFSTRLSWRLFGWLALAGCTLQQAAAQQALTVSPFQLGVYFQRDTPNGAAVSRALELTNITTRVQVTTTVDAPINVNWLFVNPTILNANEGATRRIDVTILPAPLAPGTYTGNIRFTPDGGTPLNVPVTLVVSNLRMQNPVPSALLFTVQRNAPRTPAVPINVTATTGSLSITASGSSVPTPWILVDPGPTPTPGSFGVSVLAGDLPVGDYTGSVIFNAAGSAGEAIGNPSINVPVRLRVVDDSRLTVAPTAISYDFQLNGPTPAGRTIAVGSTGSPLTFTAELATPGTSVQWLTASPLFGTTPQNIALSLQNLGNLAAGAYSGTITIRTSNGQSQVVTINLRVATDPLVTVTPGQLTFTFQQGGSQPPRQTVIVSNFGNPATLTAAAVAPANTWLTVTPSTATTPAALVVGVNTLNLSPGTYDGAIAVSGAFGNSPATIPVRLVISPSTQSLLRVDQNQLNFAFQTGSATTTLAQTINVSSTSAATLQFSATGSGGTGWLTVTPVGSVNTPGAVTVSVVPGSLPPGVYTAQVAIQTPEVTAIPIVVPVRMVISTQPLLNVTPSSLNFQLTGTSTSQRQLISVASTGTNFAYQATSSVAGGGTWLVIAQSGLSTGSTVEVGVNPVVTEGSGLVTITAPGIENSPIFVPVTLSNTGTTSQLTITPGQLDFVQIVGAAAPLSQTLDISLGTGTGLTNYRVGELRYLIGTGWLKLSKTAGIAPDKVEVSVDTIGLAVGRYAATIPFESSVGNRDVVVFLEVKRLVSAFTVSPETLTFSFTPGSQTPAPQTVQVGTTGDAIPYTAAATVAPGVNAWLVLNTTSGSTPSLLSVSVNPTNLAGGTYQGTITLTGAGGITRAINVTLNVAAVATPVLSRILNAASFTDVAAVPGMIISLTGTNLGPAVGVAAAPNGSGVFDRTLANVKVVFETFEAPILYVSAGQINAIVPYLIAPRVSTRVYVEVNGVRSNTIELRVAAAAPGIFLISAAGQGAILNQDNTVNGPGNPAARESIVVIYGTGEGQTNPPGVDGTIPGRSTGYKVPVQRVRVRIGGQEAEVLYGGSAPLLVSGALQVNARVPAGVTPGPAVPIELIVGETASPAGVTLAVR